MAQAHRVRMQVQGDDMDPERSSSFEKDYIMTKQEAIDMLNDLWNKLTPVQKADREDAYEKAKNYIGDSPSGGRISQGSKSFQQSNRRVSNARIDIEINRGAAFSNDRHIVYIRFVGSDFGSNPVWQYDEKHVPTKKLALQEMKEMWDRLSADQKRPREDAYKDAVQFINSSNSNGREGSNSITTFTDSDAKMGEKITITIDKGAAFSD